MNSSSSSTWLDRLHDLDRPDRATPRYDELRGRVNAADGQLAAPWRLFLGLLEPTAAGASDPQVSGAPAPGAVEASAALFCGDTDLQLPTLLSRSEGLQIAQGLIERAELMQALCTDAYGPEQLTRRALLPQALVRGHPAYLRALHTRTGAPAIPLRLLAFDLARSPEGQWYVLSQSHADPRGLAALLGQRRRSQSHLGAVMSVLGAQSLETARQALIESLQAHYGQAQERPLVFLRGDDPITGCTDAQVGMHDLGLVEAHSHDLLLRRGQLFLKALGGPMAVRCLISGLPDGPIDPLEQGGSSAEGVPGLMQAVRAGKLHLAQHPGAGFLQSPALAGFLPALHQALRGSSLRLPDRGACWCGEKAALESILPDLDSFDVVPTYAAGDTAAAIRFDRPGDRLARLRSQGEDYTLRARMKGSITPVWHQGQLQMHEVSWRFFLFRDASGRWQMFPGALARLRDLGDDAASPLWADTWILGQEPGPAPTRAPAPPTKPLLARQAQDGLWLGRYMARAEHGVRALEVALILLRDPSGLSVPLRAWIDGLVRAATLLPDQAPSALLSPGSLRQALLADGSEPADRPELKVLRETAERLQDRQAAETVTRLIQAWKDVKAQASGEERVQVPRILEALGADSTGSWQSPPDVALPPESPWQHPVAAPLADLGRAFEGLIFAAQLTYEACASNAQSEPLWARALERIVGKTDAGLPARGAEPVQGPLGALSELAQAQGLHPQMERLQQALVRLQSGLTAAGQGLPSLIGPSAPLEGGPGQGWMQQDQEPLQALGELIEAARSSWTQILGRLIGGDPQPAQD